MKQTLMLVCVLLWACGPDPRKGGDDDDDGSSCPVCTADKQGFIDCDGVSHACPPDQSCSDGQCLNSCQAAEQNHESVGCDYYAVDMDAGKMPPGDPPLDACYTVFVANTSRTNVHINAEFGAQSIDLSQFAKLPQGQGMSLTYGPYNPTLGIEPGQVAILFLGYGFQLGNVACPVPAAIGTEAQLTGTGVSTAFHITTDSPVVAYQMLPYGGGKAAATGASLLIPSSAWGDNYVAMSASEGMALPFPAPFIHAPSYNVVAKEDDTIVTMRPKSAITAGGMLPAGPANQPYTFTLMKGQHAQFTQLDTLTGSPISANKPIGMFGGHESMGFDRCCADHGEQMLAPVRALGHEYVAAPHADRQPWVGEPRVYKILGAVDGTALTYEPPGIGPDHVDLGQLLEIRSPTPFVVRSQDDAHPFQMFTLMTGGGLLQGDEGYDPMYSNGFGDADFVRLVPPQQYLSHYVFFTDPTYAITALTVVRAKKKDGGFEDVTMDCMSAPLTGWTKVGDYEITYVKMVDHFTGQFGCNNGVRTMTSAAPFGVWVWGWGSETDGHTGWVSYGYPAGEGVVPINDVIILSGHL